MAIKPGTEVGGYVVERRLGAGGMGTVYLAKHPRLPRKDALKILADGLSTNPDFRARFEREADLAGALNHPNIVAVHDRGEADEQLWIAMQYVDGPDAQTYCAERGRLTADDALWICRDVASALDHAHEQGLLHRDVKPANILLDLGHNRHRALLSDFGIARAAGATQLTGTGMAFGSAGFSSPEQLGANPVDARSDVYALGCTLYALLTGGSPFPTDNLAQALLAHLNEPPPRLTVKRPDLPPQVDAVIFRALAKNPDQRYPTAGAMVDDFAAALEGRTPSQPTAIAPAPPQHTQVRHSGPVPPRSGPVHATPPPSRPVPYPQVQHPGPPSRPVPMPPQYAPAPMPQYAQAPAGYGYGPQGWQPPAPKKPWEPPAPGPSILPVNGRWIAALAAVLLIPVLLSYTLYISGPSPYYLIPTAPLLLASVLLAAGVRPFIAAQAARVTIWLLPLTAIIYALAIHFWLDNDAFSAVWAAVAAVTIFAGVVWARPPWFGAVLAVTLGAVPLFAVLIRLYGSAHIPSIYTSSGLAAVFAVAGLLLLLTRSPIVTTAYLAVYSAMGIVTGFMNLGHEDDAALSNYGSWGLDYWDYGGYIFNGYPDGESTGLYFVLFGVLPGISIVVAGIVEQRRRSTSPATSAR